MRIVGGAIPRSQRISPSFRGLALGMVVAVLTLHGCAKRNSEYYVLATLDCGQSRSIVLSGSHFCEPSSGSGPLVFYQVFVNGRETVPLNMAGEVSPDRLPYDIDRLTYHLACSRNSEIVGVMVKELPYVVIVVHDFSSGESWPHDFHKGGPLEEGYLKQQALRERLEADNPWISLVGKVQDEKYVRKVHSLHLSYSRVGDQHLYALNGLANIEALHLWHTMVGDDGLEHIVTLPNLRHLDLSCTAVTDAGLAQLKKLRQLDWVDLSGTKVTDKGIAELRAALPDTKVWWRDRR